jgi:hypothetical protein
MTLNCHSRRALKNLWLADALTALRYMLLSVLRKLQEVSAVSPGRTAIACALPSAAASPAATACSCTAAGLPKLPLDMPAAVEERTWQAATN